ncbi:MAG: inorganic phosphate transporter [Bdellovibrionales bacterium]|nr:inorganic phosphate transporter [Bdellovibrionales bacterium]
MTFGILLGLFAGLFLAFSNGANDNFKGVATLLGSKTATYKIALSWATLTTFLGSVAAFFLANKLMVNFSGKGLVEDSVVQMASFSIAVALAAAFTVFLATKIGFPISTTHALTGALVGAGFLASPAGLNFSKLFSSFFLPLIVSPFLAILGALIFYPCLSFLRKQFGVSRETCLCIGNNVVAAAPQGALNGALSATLHVDTLPDVSIGTKVTCEERYIGHVWGFNAKIILDIAHFMSAGLVSFARGLNDTPKIAAILLIGGAFQPAVAIGATGVAIAIGGILFVKRIAETMSYQITEMNDGQGFTANILTSIIVIGASKLGMPVSTTHVSCGSLFGIGAVTKQAHWGSIMKIVLAWIVTLPLAATLGYVFFFALEGRI